MTPSTQKILEDALSLPEKERSKSTHLAATRSSSSLVEQRGEPGLTGVVRMLNGISGSTRQRQQSTCRYEAVGDRVPYR